MPSRRTNKLFLFIFLTLYVVQIFGNGTREHLLDSREKRKKQLENILKNVNENLDDHRSGKTTLPNNKVEHYEHLQRAYEHQLDDLSRELDEEEIQRKLEAYNKLKNDRTGDEL